MPTADRSYFPPGLSKDEVYAQVLEQARGLMEGKRNWGTGYLVSGQALIESPYLLFQLSNLANLASLLWYAYASLPAPSSSVNWVGFYIRSDKFPPSTQQQQQSSEPLRILLLGPFQGKPACQLINFGRGVCGTAAARTESVVVPDVLEWPGHIACDAASRSEIVVPILVGEKTVAIIDVDCAEHAGFDDADKRGLESLAELIAEGCDW